jgi:hypothetical protein
MTEFSMDSWFAGVGISEAGQKKLLAAEVKDAVVIEELDDTTLLTIKLAAGDYVKFRKAQSVFWKKLEVLPVLEDQNPTIQEAKKAASASSGLYSLDQFASFLAGKSSLLTPTGVPVDPSMMFGGVDLPKPSTEEGAVASSMVSPKIATDAVALGKSLMKDLLCMDDCCTNDKGEKFYFLSILCPLLGE